MEQRWRIHWNDRRVSDWMAAEALYNTIWAKEAMVLYIESEDLLPHINNVLELMKQGHTAMSQWGELLLYRGGDYYIDTRAVFEYEIRAALQIRYTVDPEDYRDDKAYIEGMLTNT